jgi:N-acetylglucosaminyl-diphospho-decaprenol L-rhamnosyltransferase
MVRLAVVIVNYNVRELLQACLASVQTSSASTADRLEVDIIVVDNASQDDSAAMVVAGFPDVHLIALDDNVGFTGGNNLALKYLGLHEAHNHPLTFSSPHSDMPDYVLLLNPDTEIVNDALWQMVRFLEDNPRAGICGARLCYGDGTFQHGAFRFPSLVQVMLDLFPLRSVRGMHRLHDSRLNGRYPASCWRSRKPFEVDFVLGAALMARAKAIRAVGGLDDEYFMYCEEMDWCMRMADAGWSIHAVPAAEVIHYAGQSSRQVRWPAFERLWRSRFRFFEKYTRRYSPIERMMIRSVVRASMRLRSTIAHRRFADGEINGVQFGEELAAYESVSKR